jgi:hypothetical protein
MVAIEGSVWVDTNQTNSFADETELKDINRQFSAATFQAEKGDRGKPLALPANFAVTIHESKSQLRFFVSEMYVGGASILAGKEFLGGKANGIASGARILYVPLGLPHGLLSYHQNLKAYILTAARPDVDVIEGGEYIVNPPFYGKTVTSLVLDRLSMQHICADVEPDHADRRSGKPRTGMLRQTTTAQKSTGSSLVRRRVSSSVTNPQKRTASRGQRPRFPNENSLFRKKTNLKRT